MANPISNCCLLFVLLCMAFSPSLAQEAGESVRIQGVVVEDVYAAGGTVDVLATVEGDVVVAGGRVTVAEHVRGGTIGRKPSAFYHVPSILQDEADQSRSGGFDRVNWLLRLDSNQDPSG